MANTRVDGTRLKLNNSFEVPGIVVWQQSQAMLPKHILPAVLHILRCHLPFPTLVVMVASLECAVRIADAVRRENKARRVTAEVYGHLVLFVKPIQPATQALTATTAARDAIPAESIFLNGNFDAVEIPGYLAAWPYSNNLLAFARIVMDIILRWWDQLLHILLHSLIWISTYTLTF